MNSDRRKTRLMIVAALAASALVLGGFIVLVWAAAEPASRPDYQGYDLENAWFDGKPWAWMLDMFNQPSIKPQESGTVQRFPLQSVPRSGAEPFIPATAMVRGQLLRDQIPTNPTEATAASIERGREMYDIFCAVCHGDKGQAGTPVTQKGMPAPPIAAMLPIFSEAHFYNKIRFGGPLMPAYGFQTSRQERWDMVNYMKSPRFGKGGAQ